MLNYKEGKNFVKSQNITKVKKQSSSTELFNTDATFSDKVQANYQVIHHTKIH